MRLSLSFPILFTVGLIGCGDNREATPPQGDTGVADSAPVDAIADTADDTARPDTAPVPLGGEWEPFANPRCSNEVAVDAAAAVPPLRFAPCVSGPAGCEELAPEWTSDADLSVRIGAGYPVRIINGKAAISYSRLYPPTTRWDVDVVQELSGPALFAVRGDPSSSCRLQLAAGELGIAVTPTWDNPNLGDTVPIVFRPWGGESKLHSIPAEALDSPALLGETRVGSTGVWVDPWSDRGDGTYGSGSAFVDLETHTASPLSWGSRPLPHGAGAIVNTWGLSWLAFDGVMTQLTPARPMWPVLTKDIDVTNGTLVWLEGYAPKPGPFTAFSMWASPVATTAAGISARRVATVTPGDFHFYVVANAGVALTSHGKTGARLTRLSDGMGWTIELGRERVIPIWVDADHVYVYLHNVDSDGGSIVRVARAKLGDPTPPPPAP